MNTVTIPRKEYKNLLEAKRKLERMTNVSSKGKALKKKEVLEKAFGIFKNGFSNGSSVSYVNKLRKEWRK